MQKNTPNAPLVLVGAGHAHLVTLGQWAAKGFSAPAGSLLINPDPHAWYSGMMPGLIAGRFQPEQCRIPLAPLCAASGLELVCAAVSSITADNSALELADGQRIAFDTLSLNSGAKAPVLFEQDQSLALIGAKPFPHFIRQWQQWLTTPPRQLAIVGAGAAGFELAMALRISLPGTQIDLFSSGTLLASHPPRLARLASNRLRKAQITLHEHSPIDRITSGQLYVKQQPVLQPQAVILATGTAAPDWQQHSGLNCDTQGFIRIDSHLRSLDHDNIFASGDCASLPQTPHSGVYAVRQGSVLADNLIAHLQGSPLGSFQPQSKALALLSCADGRALLSYGPLASEGKLAGRFKDWLDLRFMQQQRLT
ncbi:FAD-dependent oxidoreductase [Pseudomonas sp. 5Ae-yellow]|uniref:FAD-dependent oxidoreductase n=1 Tax=Pseudomonas sp. 5Ae-yellow TaxID=2759848 RepID=UPI0015F39D76|nr:FAD-dependent oxidoreductase [Pseudomonas sp. 5Ae-yellow]MBA6419304.1 FAD-dependent oxidoreductase [Pseudomonas sp. 5Ae-yellow]|tara:strand:+ start:2836 stop:3933 length:1098 start_codon:yes stop_codon:yes gene_type:complete